MTPTTEQTTTVDLFRSGRTMVVEAGAGTGKTSTLRLIAEAAPAKRIQYLAFNKAIVTDAAGSMPANTTCSTAHSLAYRAVGGGCGRWRSPVSSASTPWPSATAGSRSTWPPGSWLGWP